MTYRLFIPIMVVALTVLVSNTSHAQDTPTYSIPSHNPFSHDFGTKCPGDILALNVVADPGYVILSAVVDNGSSAGWVGGPSYTAVIPDNFPGVHLGFFSGTYDKIGGGGGTGGGQNQPPPWNGKAKADVVKIVSRTIKHAPDGTPDSRRVIGICEDVEFSTEPALDVDWTASSGTPTTKTGSSTFLWHSPDTPQNVEITAKCPSGNVLSASISVIFPTISGQKSYDFVGGVDLPLANAGAGMNIDLFFTPDSVNFGNTQWGEGAAPPANVVGYFVTLPAPGHLAQPFQDINDDNTGPFDVAALINLPAPWSNGSFDWSIPELSRCKGTAGAGNEFQKANQAFTITSNGTVTVSKFAQTATRTAGNP